MAPKGQPKQGPQRRGLSPVPHGAARSRGSSPAPGGRGAVALASEPGVEASQVVRVFDAVPSLAQGDALDILNAAAVEHITADDLFQIQKMHRPPVVVQRVLEFACMILGARRSAKPQAPPEWKKTREHIADDSFIPAVLEFDVRYLASSPALTRFLHERFFGTDAITYVRVLHASTAAAALYKWCSAIIVKAEEVVELSETTEPVEKESPPEPEPLVQEPPPPDQESPEPPPESEPTVDEPPPRFEQMPSVPCASPLTPTHPEEPVPAEEELPLPLTEVELSHLSFRRNAGVCPDGWSQDCDCVVCFLWAHLEFRRDAGVCPDGFEEDLQCSTCGMFAGLKTFVSGGEMPTCGLSEAGLARLGLQPGQILQT